jgi:hypothetical protein
MDVDLMECDECGILYNDHTRECAVCKGQLRPAYLDVNEDK